MKKLLTLLLIAFSITPFAQEIKDPIPPKDSLKNNSLVAEENYKRYIPTFAPLSTNAAAIQKNGDYPINMATGIPDIKILLGNARSGKLNSPIYLRNHASGFKIDDLASWVGWGWSLDFGPTLNRAVKGQADDKDGTTGNNYLNNPIVARDFCNSTSDYQFGKAVVAGQADIKPDLFSYSIFKNSGKFYLGQTTSPNFLMPFQPIQINKHVNANGFLTDFDLINQEGVNFTFGKQKNGVFAHETFSMVSGSTTQNHINNWLITQIKAPNSPDEISFDYQNGGSQYSSSLSYSATMYYNCVGDHYQQSSNVVPVETNTLSTITQTNIFKITHENGYIEFEQSNPAVENRLDLPNSRYLKNIKFYNLVDGTYQLMRTVSFHYGYFDGVNEKRLKLESVTINEDYDDEGETYSFDYFTNTFSWNTTDSYRLKQDYFGYFNGKPNTHLIGVGSYNSINIYQGAADRSTVDTYSKEGVLKKITYPTKGYTEFDYENNKYDFNGTTKLAGGLRVKSIKSTAGLSTQPILKRYTYGIGTVNEIGKFTTNWFPENAAVPQILNLRYLSISVGGDATATQAILSQNGFLDADTYDQAPLYYTHVNEYFEDAAATVKNGHNEYVYDFRPDLQIESQGYFSRSVKPWLRGNLVSKKTYNSNNTLVESTINSYNDFDAKASELPIGAGIVSPNVLEGGGSGDGFITACTNNPDFFSNFPTMVYDRLYYQTGSRVLEKSTIVMDGVTTEQNHYYDGNMMLNKTESLDSYTNHKLIEETKYPIDASYNGNAVVTEMRARNMLDSPLETEEYENLNGTTNPIYKQKNIFAEFNGSNARGLTKNILQSQIQVAPNGGSLETRVEFPEYDNAGNPLEYKVDGFPTALLWGYGSNELVGLVKNSTKSEVGAELTAANIDLADFSVTTLIPAQIAKLSNFRNALPNAQASWFAHIPHVGMSEMVGINGLKTTFEFDVMQRFKLSKDHEGNLLNFNAYNFGTNPKITSSVFRTETTNNDDASNHTKANITTTYFDGLGNEVQKVGLKLSPNLNDIVSNSIELDLYGRAFKSYLPAPATTGTGAYQADPQSLGNTFYGDDRPFSQVLVYENSPLNREKETIGAGKIWNDNNKKITHFYESAGTDVRYYYLDGSNNIKKSGNFPANSLFKKRTKDEEEHETISITDKRGRLIQSQQQDATGYITTYYIYDGAGRTRAVIQPEGYELDSDIDNGSDAWNRWVFFFKYDTRGRNFEKKVPGAEIEEYVFDKRDRKIMSQDGFQRHYKTDPLNAGEAESPQWVFYKFDAFDRLVYSGLKASSSNRSDLQTAANSVTGLGETINGTEPFYSLGTTYPSVSAGEIKFTNLFDTYSWKPSALDYLAGETAITPYSDAKGFLTGVYARSSIDNAWLKTASYYDTKSREIQSRNNNHISGAWIETNTKEYNFAGDVLVNKILHKKNGAGDTEETIKESNHNNYDLASRLVSNFHKINDIQQNIGEYKSDELGRLQIKNIGVGGSSTTLANGLWNNTNSWANFQLPSLNNTVTINHNITVPPNYEGYAGMLIMGNATMLMEQDSKITLGNNQTNSLLQKIDFKYHIRGGLLGVNLNGTTPSVANDNDLFSFGLTHGFDGNITAQNWKDKAANQDRSWAYAYDPANRISSATYSPSGTYTVSGITYDKNGNIKTMNRNAVDALSYDYTNSGNQLQKVTDGTTGNTDVGDFRDGNTAGSDYEYYTDGSLKVDKNKGISLIEYDPFLKKINKVSFTNGKWIIFRYSGNGTLIQRENSDSEKWDYTNGLIYKGGVPYQMNTNEGRAVWNGTSWEYEYEYRDIWGNLRLTYKNQSGVAAATQSADYDIFGYEFNKQTQAKSNFYKYQKQERVEDFGLNIDLFKFRPSDSQIGRFWMIDPLASDYAYNSPYNLQENKFGLGVELEGKELSEFFKGFNNALREDIIPFSQSANRSFESNNYSLGKSAGHIGAAIFGVAEIIVGGTGDAGAAVGTVGSAGLATPVTAPLAIGATALIGHGLSVVGKAVSNLNSSGEKTHQTYTKPDKNGGKPYSGKTSGTGTPEENIAKRDQGHHMDKKGFGKAVLDKSSKSSDAIRGREQNLIDNNGGSKSTGGTSGNQNNSIGPKNKNAEKYKQAAEKEFGN